MRNFVQTFSFSRKSPDFYVFAKNFVTMIQFFRKFQVASRICSWLTHIFARTFGKQIFSRTFSQKQIFSQKSKYFYENDAFVSHLADKFFNFCNTLKVGQQLLIFATILARFSRKCENDFLKTCFNSILKPKTTEAQAWYMWNLSACEQLP